MPSFDTYKKINGKYGTNGRYKKYQSDMIEEATWNESIESQVAYFYDYYLDDQPFEYKNLNSHKSKTKIPVEIKFIVGAHNSDSKDQVSYKIQFKPSFNWEEFSSFDFYKDRFEKRYSAEYPVGMYIDIADEKGRYRKWLVTSRANWLDDQFPTWYVLPCDFCFRWIFENTKYSLCGVSRAQNS